MRYAIVESGGKQYKAVEGSTILVDLLDVRVGEIVMLDKVVLLANDSDIKVGCPTVPGARVKTTVVNHEKGEKIIVFRYSPKKRIRAKTGHRQVYTLLSVHSIEME